MNHYQRHQQEESVAQKDMYVINMDLSRLFWMIAIGLFMLTFFFLFGYWLGSDTNYLDLLQKDNIASRQNYDPDNQVTHSTLQEVQTVTNEAMQNNDMEPVISQGDDRIGMAEQPDTEEDSFEANSMESVPAPRARRRLKTRRRVTRRKDSKLSRTRPYVVQISIHKVKRNAYHMLDILTHEGFPSYIYTTQNSIGETLYYVRVGPFRSEMAAQESQMQTRTLPEIKDSIVMSR